MSTAAKKLFDAAGAAAKASANADVHGELLATGGRLWRFGDAKAKMVIKILYAWIGALILFAFIPSSFFLYVMAALPIAVILYMPAAEPFASFAAGIADERVFQGKTRQFIATVAGYEIAATFALWLIPLQNDRGLALWLILAVAGIVSLKLAVPGKTTDTFRSFLMLVAIGIVIFLFLGGRTGVQEKMDSQKASPPQQATQRSVATGSSGGSSQGAAKPAPSTAVSKVEPFYAVNECAGEPESRNFAPGSSAQMITVNDGCWTSIIKMPLGSSFKVEARGPVDIMYVSGSIDRPKATTGFMITDTGSGSYATFRLKARNAPEQTKITLTD